MEKEPSLLTNRRKESEEKEKLIQLGRKFVEDEWRREYERWVEKRRGREKEEGREPGTHFFQVSGEGEASAEFELKDLDSVNPKIFELIGMWLELVSGIASIFKEKGNVDELFFGKEPLWSQLKNLPEDTKKQIIQRWKDSSSEFTKIQKEIDAIYKQKISKAEKLIIEFFKNEMTAFSLSLTILEQLLFL